MREPPRPVPNSPGRGWLWPGVRGAEPRAVSRLRGMGRLVGVAMPDPPRDNRDSVTPPPGEPLIEVGEPLTVTDEDLDLLFDAIHRALEKANEPPPTQHP